MKKYIAKNILNLPKSGIRDFFELVIGMDDVISLGVGEPDFVTPWKIREATIYAIETGKTMYTSNLGLLSLRKEISNYYFENFNVNYNPEQEIIITVGVSEGLDILLRAITNPDDEIIYHEPSYVSYAPEIKMAGGVPVCINTKEDENFEIKAKDIEKKITNKTKAILLNYPNNPTGAVLSKNEADKIVELIKKHDILLISDEIYYDLNYTNEKLSFTNYTEIKDKLICLNGFSKNFAMTGYRIGYALGNKNIIDAMMKIHQYSMLCAPVMAQEAAIEAIKNCQHEKQDMINEYNNRRKYVYNYFVNEIGFDCIQPKGAFYIFPSIKKTGLSATDFSLKLLEQEKVAVVPGNAFGEKYNDYIRCSYATSLKELETAMKKIKKFVNNI